MYRDGILSNGNLKTYLLARMNSAVTLRVGTGRKQVGELTSLAASSIKTGNQAQHEEVNFDTNSSIAEKHGRPSTPLEQVTCTGVQLGYPKGPEQDSYSKLTRKSLERENCGGGGSSGAGLRLPSTRVTVYPQRDIETWKGRRDFSLPRLDVLKVQLERRGLDEEQGTNPRSLSVPNSAWLPRAWDLGRTRSADSYFRHGQRQGETGSHFQTRVQMERAFNVYVNSKSQPSVPPPARPNTSTSAYSSRQASASSNHKDAAHKTPTLTWYSAPNRQRVVRQSPPWRSLMNRRPRGVRADNSNLCPYHCRCCFNEVNEIESCTVYKMDLGAL